jgi:NIMA (never in mitosis gene a)-related kinase
VRVLGKGSFGTAYLVERKTDNQKLVMKTNQMLRISKEERQDIINEAKVMEHVQHPNLTQFVEFFEEKSTGKLCIVMDFADDGDLHAKIKKKQGYFEERLILDWFVQICLGMKHLHDRKILHRDIKSQNVFLTRSGVIKIGDFGTSKVLSQTMQKARTQVGTPYYLSPEIIKEQPYSFLTDVWSMGILLAELCIKKPPFDATSIMQLGRKICSGLYTPIPSHYSQDMRNLVKACLQVDVRKRPSVNQILQMPFVKERIQQFLSE